MSERYLYLNGRLVPYSEATIHVQSNAVKYGTLIQLLGERHGLTVQEREIDRTELYVAEEAFVCGSGWEVTAIGSVDRLPLGGPAPGPLTRAIAQTYFQAARGETGAYRHWLTPVYGSR